jgi:hypothetical protein
VRHHYPKHRIGSASGADSCSLLYLQMFPLYDDNEEDSTSAMSSFVATFFEIQVPLTSFTHFTPFQQLPPPNPSNIAPSAQQSFQTAGMPWHHMPQHPLQVTTITGSTAPMLTSASLPPAAPGPI